MQKQVYYGRWIVAETNNGTEAIPFDVVFNTQNKKKIGFGYDDIKDFLEGNKLFSSEIVDGYGARLSATGYMDCTEWTVFKTEAEAWDYLETFDDE